MLEIITLNGSHWFGVREGLRRLVSLTSEPHPQKSKFQMALSVLHFAPHLSPVEILLCWSKSALKTRSCVTLLFICQ